MATNLFGNSNGTTLAGYTRRNAGGVESISVSTEQAAQGMHSLLAVTQGVAADEGITMHETSPYARGSINSGTQYTASASVYYLGASLGFRFTVQQYQSNLVFVASASSTPTHLGLGWQRFVLTFSSNASASFGTLLVSTLTTAAIQFYLDAMQIETGPAASTYVETGTADEIRVYANQLHGIGAGW